MNKEEQMKNGERCQSCAAMSIVLKTFTREIWDLAVSGDSLSFWSSPSKSKFSIPVL